MHQRGTARQKQLTREFGGECHVLEESLIHRGWVVKKYAIDHGKLQIVVFFQPNATGTKSCPKIHIENLVCGIQSR